MHITTLTHEFVVHLNRKLGADGILFSAEAGRRFDKIFQTSHNSVYVHAFIERDSGDLIKAGSYKAPQSGAYGLAVRYRLGTEQGMAAAKAACDRHGSYLYEKQAQTANAIQMLVGKKS